MCSKAVAMLIFCIFVPILRRRGWLFAWLPWLTKGLQGKMMSCSSSKSKSMLEKGMCFQGKWMTGRTTYQGTLESSETLSRLKKKKWTLWEKLWKPHRACSENRLGKYSDLGTLNAKAEGRYSLKGSVPLTGFHIPIVYLRFVSQGFAQVHEGPQKRMDLVPTNFEPSKRWAMRPLEKVRESLV